VLGRPATPAPPPRSHVRAVRPPPGSHVWSSAPAGPTDAVAPDPS